MERMDAPSITIDDLAKEYALGEAGSGYRTVRETLVNAVGASFRRLIPKARADYATKAATIWALDGVSADIAPGEVVGIIGNNGAGKTTLLKILSRITEPTRGRVVIRGRVGSLLEVGTGFHPELTGRENVFLNGAILGMRRVEIERKFDEIVDFAEVARFIDTPVKRYSSGMYTRLAFSVAAHMEPDVLLVDEVLAVGDLAFQKKCIGKMDEVSGMGRTVLFVSHNMQAVRNLCPRTIVLDHGRVLCDAPTGESIARYNELNRTRRVGSETALHDPDYRRGSGSARFTDIRIVDVGEEMRFEYDMGETVRFTLAYRTTTQVPELLASVALRSALSGEFVTTMRHVVSSEPLPANASGEIVIECPEIMIRPGQYPLYFWLGNSMAQPFDVVDDLTAPLVIHPGSNLDHWDFNPEAPVGLVSVTSRLVRG
jgi:lipopolysaccharide transport system ATP-binding protein